MRAITGRVGIGQRLKVVKERPRVWDIEVDLMMGSNHKLALLVMTDRTILVTMIEKLKSKNTDEFYEKINNNQLILALAW